MFLTRFDYCFNFMGKRFYALALSVILMVASIGTFVVQGLVFGIDFTGGTLVEVGYTQSVVLEDIRQALQDEGFPKAVVQHFGTTQDVIIRVGKYENNPDNPLSSQILTILKKAQPDVSLRRVEYVGPQVGPQLIEQGGLAVLYTLIGILIYVAFRFEYRFALGAIAALIHDTIITVGFFSFFHLEFDLTVLAAVLAVIGYSLNDTIVVFDRIRDNFLKMRKQPPIDIMNISINQMLGRTIMTSTTTLLVLIVLFAVGGELIHNFATALIVGIVVGTYSSIYVASALSLALGINKTDLMPVQKESVDRQQP